MPFQIIRNDITRVHADVIVNTANPHPTIGRGTDSAIYRAAGARRLLEERRKIGRIGRGEAAATLAFGLPAKYIIHTVGPRWNGGEQGEREILRSCYANSLALAEQLAAESIAFPLISTGVYGFPKDEALRIALDEIREFLDTHEMNVILVVFDRKAVQLSAGLVGAINEYIDEHAVREIRNEEYSEHFRRGIRRLELEQRWEGPEPWKEEPWEAEPWEPERIEDFSEEESGIVFPGAVFADSMPVAAPRPAATSAPAAAEAPEAQGKTLEEYLGTAGETFQQRLFRLIDERGMDDVTVYKTANVDRKVFSRIRCNPSYRPKKQTAVALAIALKLDLTEMQDLLSRAELALSPTSKSDLIISYFVSNGVYDIFEINAALFQYGQPTIGAML